MHPVRKSFPELLRSREPLVGTLLSLPSPEIAEICADAGFDWLFIDMEHGLFDFVAAQRMVQTVGHRCPCVLRVPANEPIWIGKALDTGAAGLIFPHVNSSRDAAAVVRAARYPPTGTRSIGIARAQGYGNRIQESIDNAASETVLIHQAEHIDAARNIEEIIAEPGVDAIFVGPFDLSASLNKPGNIADPEVQHAIGRIRDACTAKPVSCGTIVRDAGGALRAFAEGYSLVCVATDTLLLTDAGRQVIKAIR
jgi:2-dehydro-3-deoxyglucarate aldolase/4-hydroxy-2-oxoheptanedioate aldolase